MPLLRVLFLAILIQGCSSQGPRLELDLKWAPLRYIEEVASVDTHTVLTKGDTSTVQNLSGWLDSYPEGWKRDSVLTHEREHSVRQGGWLSTQLWCLRYNHSSSFRWQEEQAGWVLEIQGWLKANNGHLPYTPESVALALSTDYDGMVSQADALTWVNQITSK